MVHPYYRTSNISPFCWGGYKRLMGELPSNRLIQSLMQHTIVDTVIIQQNQRCIYSAITPPIDYPCRIMSQPNKVPDSTWLKTATLDQLSTRETLICALYDLNAVKLGGTQIINRLCLDLFSCRVG